MTTANEALDRASQYLRNALVMNQEELRLQQIFQDWLPDEIIDAHTHVNDRRHVCTESVPPELLRLQKSTFLYADHQMHEQIKQVFLPGKTIRQIAFAFPFGGIDLTAANANLISLAAHDSRYIPFATGLASDCSALLRDFASDRFYGIKMYPSDIYFSANLYDAFPEVVLEFANERSLSITFHLPLPVHRLVAEVVEFAHRYPAIPIILAHMGIEKIVTPDLENAYRTISHCDNIYLDTAMVTDPAVIGLALNYFGHTRILFGSDQPLNLLRGRAVQHPVLGIRFVTDFNYHWADPEEQASLRPQLGEVVHGYWKIMLAIKTAIEQSGLSEKLAKENIFHNNALRIVSR